MVKPLDVLETFNQYLQKMKKKIWHKYKNYISKNTWHAF